MLRSMASRLVLLALAVLAVVAAPAAAGADAAASTDANAPSYFVLIDAGSTGSRAHVHKYYMDPSRPLPVVEASENKKIKPGLSSYAKAPADAAKSVQDLLEFIKSKVPQEQWARTPIQVHATAGLRSVTPAEAASVLDVVRESLSRSGFLFESQWARIISGEQEGINGWMAVNYLLGVFDTPAARKGEAAVAPPASTGVVEMGGSSMQITFAPADPTPDERKQLNEINVAGHTYWLYTHSFLQYGLQAAELLYQKLAISAIEEHGNPCYPPGYRHSSVGDFDQCTSSLASVVDKSIACASAHCSFNGVYQPSIGSEAFLAIENFYYTAKFFGTDQQQDATTAPSTTPSVGNQLTKGLRLKGKEFCNQEWGRLQTHYAATPADELKAFCFSAAYQTVVLESGLGFGPATNLRVAKTIRDKAIDWELGAVLFELLPKDEATAAKQRADEEARLAAKRPFVFDDADGRMRLATVSSSEAGAGGAAAHGEPWCKQCLLYTLLFAAVVVLVYMGYTRFYRSKNAGMPHSYSQVGSLNRV